MSNQQPWDPWQKQGRPQYPPQQPYAQQQPYGQQPHPQGQPQYGQPGPGQYQGQPPYQGYGYAPQPRVPPSGPPRKRRHRGLKIFAGACVGFLLLVVVIVAASGARGAVRLRPLPLRLL